METIGLSPDNKLQTNLPCFSSFPVSETPTLSISPLHYSNSAQSYCLSTEVLPMEFSQESFSRLLSPLQYGLNFLSPLLLFVTRILFTTPGVDGSDHTPGSPGTLFFVLSRHTPSVVATVFKLFGSGVNAVGITSFLSLSYPFQLPPTGGSFIMQ